MCLVYNKQLIVVYFPSFLYPFSIEKEMTDKNMDYVILSFAACGDFEIMRL